MKAYSPASRFSGLVLFALCILGFVSTVGASPNDGIVDVGETGWAGGGTKPWDMSVDGVSFPVFCLDASTPSPAGSYTVVSEASLPGNVAGVKDKIQRLFGAYLSGYSGADVQDAIWYFTNNITPSGVAATLVANVNTFTPYPLYWLDPDGNSQFVGGGPVLKDWGDFSGFATASHVVVSNVYLGSGVDGEADGGLSDTGASADDGSNTGMADDEDGVTLPSSALPGQTISIQVNAHVAGRLNAWIDWNNNGTLATTERIANDQAVSAGVTTLSVTVPANAPVNANLGARFRFTSAAGQGTSPTGEAPNGEVEDYVLFVDGPDYDFGDLVDTGAGTGTGNYESLLANDGPRHQIANSAQRLGSSVNSEADAKQSGFAGGDGTSDNGVTIPSLTAGQSASFTVNANVAGYLSAWVDWNRDGDFADTNETLTTSMSVSAGSNSLSVSVPMTAVTGQSLGARFRFTVDAGTADTPYGLSPSGEVEDYGVTVTPSGPIYDFGDLLDPTAGTSYWDYQTLLARNGPRHQIVDPSQCLGGSVDYESDANQGGWLADGDGGDEDGVYIDSLYLGTATTIFVDANVAGYLNAWIDWNGDGDFADSGEKIAADLSLAAGSNTINLTVPANATVGITGGRFRFTTGSGQATTPYGSAPNGEVEDYDVWIADAPKDYGDLVDTTSGTGAGNYQTYYANNGPRHGMGDGYYYLGSGWGSHVDYEADANVSGFADGDAYDDGVSFGTLMQGQSGQITVTASQAGYLNAWIDWNRDGDFADSGEKIANEQAVTGGANTITVSVPATAITGYDLGARFRFTSTAGQALIPSGEAADGEVEDYGVRVYDPSQVFDFGDLVDTGVGTGYGNYQTKLNDNGARHTIANSSQRLGATVNAEPEANQSGFASGDSGDDGVTLPPLVAGLSATIVVNANVSGRLNAWIDWNGDGDFADTGEKIANEQAVAAGNNNVTITVPDVYSVLTNTTLGARFRFTVSTGQGTNPTGLAPNGEAEDYSVVVSDQPYDFGDLADTGAGTGAGNYETLLANNGPVHAIVKPTEHLGATINYENNAKQSGLAGGDGTTDDGVTIPLLPAGQTANLVVNASIAGFLNAWIDWNGDGDFNDANEQIVVTDRPVSAGNNNVSISVPNGITNGAVVGARFRYTEYEGGATTPYGLAPSGEVEDYAVVIGTPNYDFGDLVDTNSSQGAGNYSTLLAYNGPRHIIMSNTERLGATIDSETNAGQSGFANGDDVTGSDDEDGVVIPPLIAGQSVTLTVNANVPGYLNAWIDWNNDGSFSNTTERAVTVDYPLVAGNNSITLTVPATATTATNLGARFRFTTGTNQAFFSYGEAPNGEVEDYAVMVAPAGSGYDFGDLVDTAAGTGAGNYESLLANNGPRHLVVSSNHRLGASVDSEANAGQSGFAAGDGADENGVTIPALTAGQSATVVVNAGVAGYLNAWVDWNNDGDFADSGERIANETSLAAGNNNLTVAVPAGAATGTSLGARFRFTLATGQAATPYGAAPNGEVEDYAVTVNSSGGGTSYDFGDLVDTAAGTGAGNYESLLANNGPRHIIVDTTQRLGATIDAETNAGQSGFAVGDGSDEDGVTIPTLTAGQSATLTVNANVAGRLNAWIDWNSDGDFADSGETIATDQALTAGNNSVSVSVPAGAVTAANLGARFRFTTGTGQATTPYGEAPNGEVEDYAVTVNAASGGGTYDFGDLVDTAAGTGAGNYETLLANNGPRHTVSGKNPPCLGATVDTEADAGQNGFATGDNTTGADDEDGVVFPSLTAGSSASLTITANVDGRLFAWIDWNGDGDFSDSGEQIAAGVGMLAGANVLTVAVPGTATVGSQLGARFRFTVGDAAGASSPVGPCADGEVEDYEVRVNASGGTTYDFGDLVDTASGTGTGNYETLLANNGPRHMVSGKNPPCLGATVDTEADAGQNGFALGDDITGSDDEDGVVIPTMTAGSSANLTITASADGRLFAWADWNGDGDFADSGEQIAAGMGLNIGANVLVVNVPAGAATGTNLGMRFRYTTVDSAGASTPYGACADGEVEDYGVTLQSPPASLGDYVWIDADMDGIQDGGETGLNGVTVDLLNSSGGVISTTTTANNPSGGAPGYYHFGNLTPGTYSVHFVVPSGYVFTTQIGAISVTDNSDANTTTGQTAQVTLAAGDNVTYVDAGLYQPASLGDYVWIDADMDGIQDGGETGLNGVTVELLNSSGGVISTTTTANNPSGGTPGYYHFGNLAPGTYSVHFVLPSGYVFTTQSGAITVASNSDANTTTGQTAQVTLSAGDNVTYVDAGIYQLASLGDYVWMDLDKDGVQNDGAGAGVNGVTVELLDGSGTVVATTVTADGGSSDPGFYHFGNLMPGTYSVRFTLPDGVVFTWHNGSLSATDNSDADRLTGETAQVTLAAGDNITYLDAGLKCPDTWADWKQLHPGEDATGNLDADAYGNFAEYAFAMPDDGTGSPHLDATAWTIRPSALAPGTLEAVFVRPTGWNTGLAQGSVTYTLQYAASAGNPTVWQSVTIDLTNATVTDNGDCTETVVIHDLETLTGLTGGTGVVRIAATQSDPTGPDSGATTRSEPEGWTETPLERCCQTYGTPYQRETVFTGTVGTVSGQDLEFIGNDLTNLLAPGVSYYAEVLSGDNAGQRFDVAATGDGTVTISADADVLSTVPPFNTLATVPASLAGDIVAIRPHWTLGGLFPVAGLVASGANTTADQVQTYAAGAWTTYWLYDLGDADPATARWVKTGDPTLADAGGAVIPPGQGMFFTKRVSAAALLTYGEIRTNPFVRPLATGAQSNLVSGGYPVDQSPAGRELTTAEGFLGTKDFKTADSIFVWQNDASPPFNSGYDTYWLLNSTTPQALNRWVKQGDATIAPRDASILFEYDRAVFLRTAADQKAYKTAAPWTP